MFSIKAILHRIISVTPEWTRTNLLSSTTSITTTATNINLTESVENFAFVEIGIATSSYSDVYTVPISEIKTTVNGNPVRQSYLCRIGSTTHRLRVTYVDNDTFSIKLYASLSGNHLIFNGFGRLNT